MRGEYDAAVFQAMKSVEIAVRETAKLTAADIGVQLMRKAFEVENGPLTDKTAERGERSMKPRSKTRTSRNRVARSIGMRRCLVLASW
jgi:hypothetical protein